MRWIIAISSSDDAAWLSFFNGTEDEVKEVLMHFVNDDKENECNWKFGTENINEMFVGDTGISAYNCFEEFTTHYVAKKASEIKTYIDDGVYV